MVNNTNTGNIGDETPSESGERGRIVEPRFNRARAGHEVSKERLKIARWALVGVGVLLFVSLLTLCCIPSPMRSEILETVILSLFNLATLIIGFVAGSSIDSNR